MATIHNFPIVLPQPGGAGAGFPSVSMIAKCVITADTTLGSDDYNILIDAGDSARDIPIFVMPSGTIVEDLGFAITQVWTESHAFTIGDTVDSDGFADTVFLVCTDTQDAAGEIMWASMSGVFAELESSVKLDSTAGCMKYLSKGPRAMYKDTGDTGDSTVTGLDTDVFELGQRYAINIHSKGAVPATGTAHIYLKYNFANFQLAPLLAHIGNAD